MTFIAACLILAAGPPPHADVKHVRVLKPDGWPTRVGDLLGRRGAAVVFVSLGCPVSISYHARLAELAKQYAERGVNIIAVLPADAIPEGLTKDAKESGLTVPLYVDRGNKLAAAVGATITPEAALLDDEGHLVYRGRIDDAYSERLKRNPRVTSDDLKRAIDTLLDVRDIRPNRTRAIGCKILFERRKVNADARYTYHRDVAPVLAKHCLPCHRPGEAGPFPLDSFEHAYRWSEDIKHFTTSRQMPPWMPARGVKFQNDRRLTEQEIAILAAWAEDGAPEGNPKERKPAPVFPGGWRLGKPDLILEAPADFNLGSTGADLFRVFPLPMGLKDDRWVVAYDVKPGSPRVVHHTLHYYDATGTGRRLEREQAKRGGKDSGPGYSVSMGVGFPPPPYQPGELPKFGGLGGWAPGQAPQKLPAGAGLFLPAKSDFLLQVHYHRDGKPATDRTRVGLYFARARIDQPWQTVTVKGMKAGDVIPAGKAEYRMKKTIFLRSDALLHNVMPHMHLLGKSIKVTLTPPGGKLQVLVDIPAWDYRWQETYWFAEPIRAEAGSRIELEGTFDNTAANPLNPSRPPKDVREGEETTDEMLYAFLGATSAAKPWQFISWADTPRPVSNADARKLLDRRVGKWETETTVAGVKVKGTEVTAWTLDGKFIESKGKSAAGETRLLAAWDDAKKAYRYWYFDSSGLTSDGTGQYDPKTRAIKWDSTGAEVEWRFVDNDTFEWSYTTRDTRGKATFEMRGTSKRKK